MTTDAPLFSIVTITKNNRDGFLRTKTSVESQSCRDLEWVVIDGASDDGTRDHLPPGALSEPDRGIYDAMNKGLERAGGGYILFLNAGDTLADIDILSTLAKVIAADRPDFLYGDALESHGFYKKARSHEKMDYGMFTHHQATLYKRENIGDLRYDVDYKIAGDYAFTRAYLRSGGMLSYIPCAICIFETGGVSQRNMRLGRREQYKARKNAGCACAKNITVYMAQSMAAWLKTNAPAIYLFVRSRISR